MQTQIKCPYCQRIYDTRSGYKWGIADITCPECALALKNNGAMRFYSKSGDITVPIKEVTRSMYDDAYFWEVLGPAMRFSRINTLYKNKELFN